MASTGKNNHLPHLNVYTFFPRDSLNVKWSLASFTWHPIREKYCIDFLAYGIPFSTYFLSNLLNRTLNFDIDMQLLSAIF